ncbi:MAG: hypothetical protein R2777_07900 [Chitinophagales bacterium]
MASYVGAPVEIEMKEKKDRVDDKNVRYKSTCRRRNSACEV